MRKLVTYIEQRITIWLLTEYLLKVIKNKAGYDRNNDAEKMEKILDLIRSCSACWDFWVYATLHLIHDDETVSEVFYRIIKEGKLSSTNHLLTLYALFVDVMSHCMLHTSKCLPHIVRSDLEKLHYHSRMHGT